ncbi:SPOR domain-containing protein [Xylanimonas allomyrinae]|uniref:SPOR domain-containing protein n=1 Tax=Xylanimonas allomyrinae TaxID=2509459 RepID=A0A4P6EKL2_9MICO|nr:SPOR domain-containing protein [Xylanimonas allomyrinae]QAY62945.1 SPOR domain-containing protein [Xylanimonas allomyrinae]
MSEESGPVTSPEYWFNTQTHEVEVGRRSSWSHLMGPYGTREEALHALDRARERSDAWDHDDAEWVAGDGPGEAEGRAADRQPS